jgi:GTP cyclohydrolase-4
MPDRPHLVVDMQASAPPVELALSRAGVTGVQKAIRIRRGDAETVMAADIECTVDLARGQKGVHMSRFPEVFDEAIGDAVLGEARIIEEIAEVIARHIVERQNAHRAEVRITARWPMRRVTPVTDLPTQEMVSLIGIAAATAETARRVVGVEATGINACPCAQGLVAGRAAERLTEAGFDVDAIEQILRLVPIATHNQRGRGTLLVGTTSEIDAETLVDLVERSMSAPVFELLKRPDELFVVEHAHLQPRFVEDSVRIALKNLLDEVPGLANEDFVLSRQVNLETIHAHDVLAERWGTVGELRSEMQGTDAAQQTTLADWLTA